MNETIIALIGYYSAIYGIDPLVALSVAQVESGLNPKAIGKVGEVGLYQITPGIFKINKKDLFNIKTNIKLGIKHLAWNKKYCSHQINNTWLICYNYGIKNAERVKHPKLFPYYKKVVAAMKKFKDGQKVMIDKLYSGTLDGEGIYRGESKEHHFKGYYKIENEFGHVMTISPERVTDYESYWQVKRNKQ